MQRKVPGMLKQRKAHWLAEVSHSLISAQQDYHNTISHLKSKCKYCTLNPVIKSKCWNTTQNNRSVKNKTKQKQLHNPTHIHKENSDWPLNYPQTDRQTDFVHMLYSNTHIHTCKHTYTHIKQSSGQPTNKLTSQHTHTHTHWWLDRSPTLADLLWAGFKAQVAHTVEAAINVHARSIATDTAVQALIFVCKLNTQPHMYTTTSHKFFLKFGI